MTNNCVRILVTTCLKIQRFLDDKHFEHITERGLTRTCLTMRRDRMFMTNPPRRGYMVRDWMTVLMSSMGRGFCSMSCCITTARTSEV